MPKFDDLTALQHQLTTIQQACARAGRGVILVLEGPDAAGKGGLIRRLSWCLDPRHLHVHATGAPDERERRQHWLQRFWQRVPEYGHIAVFDRSWYGRVLVERVEGFASEAQWQRAYTEINHFEQSLVDEGFVLIKIWLQISAETQLKRLQARYASPTKQWKLSPEDLRNRAKWPEYQQALSDLLQHTNPASAPWFVLDANDKQQLRKDAFELLISRIGEGLDLTPPPLDPSLQQFFQAKQQ